jgi:hypothetical protein
MSNQKKMKRSKTLIIAIVATLFAHIGSAQTVDEIINKYFENTGGKAKWEALNGVKMTAKVNVQGMELPINIIQLKDGRQSTTYTFQGMEFREGVYDGTTLWGTNQMTMKAEKSDAETTENFKTTVGRDFPDPFLNYSAKGYKAELIGKETIDGAETFKIKLTKKPIKVDGKETESVSFYYFDAENFVPLVIENEIKSGPAKGAISQVKMSDYQDVNGFMFPFSMTQGAKGQPGGQAITLTTIEIDPKIDPALFVFPAGN